HRALEDAVTLRLQHAHDQPLACVLTVDVFEALGRLVGHYLALALAASSMSFSSSFESASDSLCRLPWKARRQYSPRERVISSWSAYSLTSRYWSSSRMRTGLVGMRLEYFSPGFFSVLNTGESSSKAAPVTSATPPNFMMPMRSKISLSPTAMLADSRLRLSL